MLCILIRIFASALVFKMKPSGMFILEKRKYRDFSPSPQWPVYRYCYNST